MSKQKSDPLLLLLSDCGCGFSAGNGGGSGVLLGRARYESLC
ncbi:hypothetical protein Sez_1709 [Streptococcus equi subsp. zooepidemicus MGCS10565]|uniref:Uncharacterized protein n=1 Tax=Streptococcus equi subsp. zooepidemicus (strain MGCS10565) TaxID=552526 RepID=B4U4X1_STREM|nr:hypothetical protein Sez_1709 [Streptococcus equi subsp. zooepidemicus MGCS10565]